MLPASPSPKAFLLPPPLKGKLPINERELRTQRLAPRPRSSGKQGGCEHAGRQLETNARGCFLWWIHSAFPPPLLPLSQIWTFTETDFMPGLPVNSLNSIEGPLSAGCNGQFPQPGGGPQSQGWVHLPSAGGGRAGWGRAWGKDWAEVPVLAGAQTGTGEAARPLNGGTRPTVAGGKGRAGESGAERGI